MKIIHYSILPPIVLLLSACSPHPVAGVWKTSEDNDYGVSMLNVSFDGRADFVTTKPDNATWHCFWGANAKQEAALDCRSSTHSELQERFVLTINEQGRAELWHRSRLVASFIRQDEHPAP